MTAARKPIGDMTAAEKREAARAEYRAVYGISPHGDGWVQRPPRERGAA